MVDWYIVEYLYPKSYMKFVNIMFPNLGVISVSMLTYYDIKKLYGFFDKEYIFLNLEMYGGNNWCYIITALNGYVVCQGHSSGSSREDIEGDGFMECFRILEKKLNMV